MAPVLLGPAWRSQLPRHYSTAHSANRLMRDMERASRAASRKAADSPSLSQMRKGTHADFFKDGDGPLFPGTFIPLPLSKYPRKPSQLVRYQWSRTRHWLAASLSVINLKLKSMSSWRTRPKWKARRSQIAPTAKAMYREVLEAFAAGDRVALHNICLTAFAARLVAAIDRRNPRERVRFQVVKYNSPLFSPRLVSHQIHPINPYDKVIATEQAVVRICSTQKASIHNAATGEIIPGSLKLQDKTEYVVLSRQVNQETFESGPWRIWGTTSPTTLERHLEEMAAIEREQARRAGWHQSMTK